MQGKLLSLRPEKQVNMGSLGLMEQRLMSETVKGTSCCLVAKLCLTLCDPMDCSRPGSSALHHLLEFAQTHVS